MGLYGENKVTFRIRWLKSFRICVGSFIELLWRDLLSTSLHIPCQNFLWARHHLWRPTDLPFQLHHSQSKVKRVEKEKLKSKSLNWFIRLHPGTSLALIVWFSQWQNYTFIQPFPLPNLALGLFWGIFPGRFNTFPFLEKSETLQKVHLVAGGKSPLETVVWILSSPGSPFAQCGAFWSILFLAVQNSSLHIKLTPTILQLCSQFFKTKMAIWDIENILMEFTFNFYPSNPKPMSPSLHISWKQKLHEPAHFLHVRNGPRSWTARFR